MISIKNLHAEVEGKPILRGIDLEIPDGEVHAIMGPNGSGKSTLASILAGREEYEVTEGSVTYKGKELLELDPTSAPAKACFWASSTRWKSRAYPTCTCCVPPSTRVANITANRKSTRSTSCRWCRRRSRHVGMSMDMVKRGVNEDFSGGEKKRNEIFQMLMLEPSLSVLDETDSGLDIDALKVVASGINRLRSPERSTMLVTHYKRLLEHVVPDRVHVLYQGRIVRSGGPELADTLEEEGYANLETDEAAATS